MHIPGLITVKPEQKDLIASLAVMVGMSFLEEGWFDTWLAALDDDYPAGDERLRERKRAIVQASFLDEFTVFAPLEGVYALPDSTAAAGAYRFSELGGLTLTDMERQAEEQGSLAALLTPREGRLLDERNEAMAAISSFDWAREHAQGRDHINFFAWAVHPEARGTGALSRLVKPIFAYADAKGLDCYLECYSDRLQSMYEHLGFELVDELHDEAFLVYERRMVRKAR